MSDRPPDLKRNPYPVLGPFGAPTGWKWFDEYGTPCEILYPTQAKALRALLAYSDWLDNGPNWYQKIWWPIRYTLWPAIVKFWNDQGHAAGKRQG